RRGAGGRDGAALGIEDFPADGRVRGGGSLVLHHRGERKPRGVAPHFSADEAFTGAEVQRLHLEEPHVTIDAGTLVEPAFALGRIHAHDEGVVPSIVDEVADIEAERYIAG